MLVHVYDRFHLIAWPIYMCGRQHRPACGWGVGDGGGEGEGRGT